MPRKSTLPTACTVDGCTSRYKAKGYCRLHYERWKRYGDPVAPRPTVSVETRRRLSQSQKVRFARDGHPHQGRKDSPETRERKRVSHLGERSYWYGRSLSAETRAKLSEHAINHWASGVGFASPQAIASGVRTRFPEANHKERELQSLLDAICPGAFQFVGNGEITIGQRVPDFIHVHGANKLVELWGSFWHHDHDPAERVEYFRSHGFETLLVWDHELADADALRLRIIAFTEVTT